MLWPSFLGAFAGTVIGALALIGAIMAWDYFVERKEKQASESPPTLDSILESHLEEYVVAHFDALFPGWEIFDDSPEGAVSSDEKGKPTGVRYRTDAGEIDILSSGLNGKRIIAHLKRSARPSPSLARLVCG